MKKSLLAILALALVCLTSVTEAQSRTRQTLVGTDGIDLLIEGPKEVDRGGTVRWLVQSLEVVGLQNLRIAPGTKIVTASSYKPNEPVEITTDAQGRGIIALAVGEDAPQSFTVSLDAAFGERAARHFDLTVTIRDPRVIEVHLPAETAVGGAVPVIGRVTNRTTGRAVANERVSLLLRGARQWNPAARSIVPPRQATTLSRRITLTTDSAGVVTHVFRLPRSFEGNFTVQMWSGENAIHEKVVGQATGRTVRPARDSLVVYAAPSVRVASPSSEVPISVVVRTPNGVPVAGAQVYFEGVDPIDTRGTSRRTGQLALSDAQGRATLRWRSPPAAQPWNDWSAAIVATEMRANTIGRTGRTDLHIRVASQPWFAEVAAENGALASMQGLSSRVFVRVVDGEGKALPAGHQVTVKGPRIAAQNIDPDASGAAQADINLQARTDNDACGGARATQVEVLVDNVSAGTQCLAVDPDAVLAVRVAPSQIAQSIQIEQASSIANRALSLSVFYPIAASSPLSRTILAAGTQSATLDLPADAVGVALIRVRPVQPGTGEETAGVNVLLELGAATSRLAAQYDATTRSLVVPAITGTTAVGVAIPALSHAEATEQWLGWNLRALRNQSSRSYLATRLELAKATPRDVATAAIVRGGVRVSIPLPADSSANLVLRDPWRIRDRFVEGRLALVLGALEKFVAAKRPSELDELAPTDARGQRRFRRELLSSLLSDDSVELEARMLESLGGQPLSIADLERLDPSVTFDAVGRRITRGRLLRVLIALRDFVKSRGFDLSWTRRGDPNEWLAALLDDESNEITEITELDLVDVWGQPLKLVATTRARAQLAPVSGFELVSAGPDRRYGTSDDMVDPARSVLPAGVYADAVREPQLVARLRNTELSRATLLALGPALFGVDNTEVNETVISEPNLTSPPLPTLLTPTRDPLRTSIVAVRAEAQLARGERIGFSLSEDASWTLVGARFAPDGRVQVDALDAVPASGLAVTVDSPDRLHPGTASNGTLTVVNLGEAPVRPSLVFTTPEGLSIEAGALTAIESGDGVNIPLTFTATQPGTFAWRVATGPSPAIVAARGSIEVLADLQPLRTMQTLLIEDNARLRVDLPSGAQAIQTRLTLVAPQALAQDPLLADFMQRDPACVLWAHVIGTQELPSSWLWSTMRKLNGGRVEGELGDNALSSVCALVAFARSEDDDIKTARSEIAQRLAQITSIDQGRTQDEQRRLYAALLAAIGPAMSSNAQDTTSDPTVRVAADWLASVRRSLSSIKNDPSLLARSAAALLLLDADDLGAQKMYELAKRHVEPGAIGKHLVPSRDHASEREDLTGTLALAVAAHAMRDETLAHDLFRYAAGRSAAIAQLGGETLFWWLASGAYGAAGQAPASVNAGENPEWQWNGSSAAIPLAQATRANVGLEGGTLLARLEATYGVAVRTQNAALSFALRGDAGRAAGRAGFELEVATDTASPAPIINIQLPAEVDATDELIELLTASPAVQHAEVRRPGMLELRLAPMTGGQTIRFALPIRWRSAAELDGLTVIGFDAASPWKQTIWRAPAFRVESRQHEQLR